MLPRQNCLPKRITMLRLEGRQKDWTDSAMLWWKNIRQQFAFMLSQLPQSCCHSIHPRNGAKDLYCCQDKPYHYSNQTCCGDRIYSRNEHVCCSNKVYPTNGTKPTCCYDKPIDPTKQLCCAGKVYPTDGSKTLGCCGNAMYDREKQICCNRKVNVL